MQIYRTLPSNEIFFERYGKYVPFIAGGIILSQILSGFTESGLIFSNVRDATLVFGNSVAMVAGIIGAIVGVALIEIVGLRVALPGTVDAFLYRRWQGLDLLFSIGLIVLCLVLIPASFILSINGGGQIVEQLKEKTEQSQQEEIKATQLNQLQEQQAEHESKQSTIEATYSELIEASKTKAEAEKVVAEQNYQHWKSKGEKYKSRINKALTTLQQIEVNYQTELNKLKQDRANELQALENRNLIAQDKIKADSEQLLIGSSNGLAAKSQAFKTGTTWIVVVAMFFSVFGIILQRIYLKGSGIEELAEPDNFYFAPSLRSEKRKLMQDRYQIKRRNKIANKRSQLPERIAYASSLPIHYVGELERTILQLKMKEGDQKQIVYLDKCQGIEAEDLEQQIQDFTEAQIQLESENNHTAAKAMELQAKQVIRLYLERNNQTANDKDITSFQAMVIDHLNEPNNYQNPFNEYRAKIGFKQQNSTTANDTQRSPLYGDRMEQKTTGKNCAHCNQSFEAKHWNAKYCGDACRIAAWEKRTGRMMKKKSKK